MDTKFLVNNTHLEQPELFNEYDPQLRRLSSMVYQYHPPLLYELPLDIPGIYTISGGRQIGKTTLLKQLMKKLLDSGMPPAAIAYFNGDLIDDHHSLFNHIDSQLKEMPSDSLQYIIVDEVSYIKDWDRAIKYAADSGLFENTIVLLSGSDTIMVKEARMRFPGRRGRADKVDFHFHPLSFKEVLKLKKIDYKSADIKTLYEQFENYLVHGGFLTAINDLAKNMVISKSTINTYADWIRGDVLKRDKNERYLREVLTAVIKRYTSQITWNSLAKDLSIDHHKTISDYLNLLESMDVLFIQSAIQEDKLTAAPKKARKVIFNDPFIYHAIAAWLWETDEPFEQQILPRVKDPIICSQLVEACVTSHFSRHYPTYYIKAEGEVDIAYVRDEKIWPIEIKWTNQIRSSDLKQIKKYRNAQIFNKTRKPGEIFEIPSIPIPLALLEIGEA